MGVKMRDLLPSKLHGSDQGSTPMDVGSFQKGKGKSDKETRVCFVCQKPGHLAKDCWQRQEKGKSGGKGKDKGRHDHNHNGANTGKGQKGGKKGSNSKGKGKGKGKSTGSIEQHGAQDAPREERWTEQEWNDWVQSSSGARSSTDAGQPSSVGALSLGMLERHSGVPCYDMCAVDLEDSPWTCFNLDTGAAETVFPA
eukprot:2079529-Amphidinium_carterae.2